MRFGPIGEMHKLEKIFKNGELHSLGLRGPIVLRLVIVSTSQSSTVRPYGGSA